MSYPREHVSVLYSGRFDLGNTATNISSIAVPFKCEVIEAIAFSETAVANSFSVGLNYCNSGTVTTANNIALIVVPDSTGAGVALFDDVASGTVLEKHSMVMVDVEEAGDSGEFGIAGLVVAYYPETIQNDATDIAETA